MSGRRCGCASDACSCVVTGGVGVEVSGSGTKTNPYVLDAALATPNLSVQDEATLIRSGVVVLNFTGGGVQATTGPAGQVNVSVPTPPTVNPQAAGVTTIAAPSALNVPTSMNVTFPVGRFSTAPIVTCIAAGTSNPQVRSPVSVSAVTATGCTLWVAQLSGTLSATTVHWHAMQAG